MNVVKEKIDSKIKELEVLPLDKVEEKIITGYEISFLKKCYEWVNTESLTAENDKKLNDLKKEALVKALDYVNRVANNAV